MAKSDLKVAGVEDIEQFRYSNITKVFLLLPLVIGPLLGVIIANEVAYADRYTMNNRSLLGEVMLLYPSSVAQVPFLVMSSLASFVFVMKPRGAFRSVMVRWGIVLGIFVGVYFTLLTLRPIIMCCSSLIGILIPLILFIVTQKMLSPRLGIQTTDRVRKPLGKIPSTAKVFHRPKVDGA